MHIEGNAASQACYFSFLKVNVKELQDWSCHCSGSWSFIFFSSEVRVALHVVRLFMNDEVVSQQEMVGAEHSPSKASKMDFG